MRSGSAFLRCSDGHVRWGLFGASGVVFVVRGGDIDDEPGTPLVMIQRRSSMAHEGGTWSCAGGALDEGEDPLTGALREAGEEVGAVPSGYRVLGQTVFAPANDWKYTTFVVEVAQRFGGSANFETDAVAWDTLDDVEAKPLHAGFAAAWPELRRIIETARS